MRTKITLALLFLNAALFAFIFYFEREWRQLERVQETRLRVLDASATDIRRLEIAGLAEPIVLERRGEDWFVAAPFEWPANPHAVKRILNELVFLEREASFTRAELERNGATLADYGLDKPALTLAFTPAGGNRFFPLPFPSISCATSNHMPTWSAASPTITWRWRPPVARRFASRLSGLALTAVRPKASSITSAS